MIVHDVLNALELIAPTRWAWEWDRVGLQIGSPAQSVTQGITCLDLTLPIAKSLAPETVVVAHHPLIWDPLTNIRTDCHQGQIIAELMAKRCAFIAAHTNWDVAPGGINGTLADRLGLQEVVSFGDSAEEKRLKLVVYAPESSVSAIVDAASDAGAGVIGDYRRCAYISHGTGTFEASLEAKPHIGHPGERTVTPEVKIEMELQIGFRDKVEGAIRAVHPYEEPVIQFKEQLAGQGQPIGRLGNLLEPTALSTVRDLVDTSLGVRSQACGDPNALVKRIAVIGGAAGDEWPTAQAAGADVFISGEFKHSTLIEASAAGIMTLEAGHFATEYPGMESLHDRLAEALPQVQWECKKPGLGEFGLSW